jgi:hypothetical protein
MWREQAQPEPPGLMAALAERLAAGGDLITASVAILVPAPGLFSTTTFWCNCPDSHSPIKRAMMSPAVPAGKPMMRRTGRAG